MAQKRWGKTPYEFTDESGTTKTVVLHGRVRWCIEELRKAGRTGRTGREALGPRWAAYVFTAKRKYGIPIHDTWEPHEGEHPGRHKRWWLGCEIRPIPQQEAAE
ncbi:winged helix domain-containing protein [Oceanicola sp. S124]|uniref:winged helix domain-containing protein n=1 Tax=Oceanicola sp. S124 TaxID=1042378 RepID=UPI000255900F|nr:hypothetical protein [Oceanicola sp. S124]